MCAFFFLKRANKAMPQTTGVPHCQHGVNPLLPKAGSCTNSSLFHTVCAQSAWNHTGLTPLSLPQTGNTQHHKVWHCCKREYSPADISQAEINSHRLHTNPPDFTDINSRPLSTRPSKQFSSQLPIIFYAYSMRSFNHLRPRESSWPRDLGPVAVSVFCI